MALDGVWVLELGMAPLKEKKALTDAIASAGGQISALLTNKAKFLVTTPHLLKTPTLKILNAYALGVSVVTQEYVFDSLSTKVDDWSYRFLGGKVLTCPHVVFLTVSV